MSNDKKNPPDPASDKRIDVLAQVLDVKTGVILKYTLSVPDLEAGRAFMRELCRPLARCASLGFAGMFADARDLRFWVAPATDKVSTAYDAWEKIVA